MNAQEAEQNLEAIRTLPAAERRRLLPGAIEALRLAVEAEIAAIKVRPRGNCTNVKPTPGFTIENSGFRTEGHPFLDAQGVLDEDGKIWVYYPKIASWVRMDGDDRYTWTPV